MCPLQMSFFKYKNSNKKSTVAKQPTLFFVFLKFTLITFSRNYSSSLTVVTINDQFTFMISFRLAVDFLFQGDPRFHITNILLIICCSAIFIHSLINKKRIRNEKILIIYIMVHNVAPLINISYHLGPMITCAHLQFSEAVTRGVP